MTDKQIALMITVAFAITFAACVYINHWQFHRPCTLYEQTEHMVSKSADGPFRLHYTVTCVSQSQP